MTLEESILKRYGIFMNIDDVAELMKIKRTSVYQQIYLGTLQLPHIKEGKKYLFPSHDVAQYLESLISRPY
jgi:excisionase family DNA binding protein|tara:strand:- start:385 stop:597 length:213 start_codon:yes stop_codon:yes gene_type:complete